MSINRNFRRCFISGITGSAGSYLAEYILKKDYSIRLYGTFRNKNKTNVIKNKSTRLSLNQLDLLNYKKLKSKIPIKIKVIINTIIASFGLDVTFSLVLIVGL